MHLFAFKPIAMLQNYLTIALRNLRKHKTFSFINIMGLAIGISTCLLILLWVADELSYDRWNENFERTYRVAGEVKFGGTHNTFAVAPSPLASALINDFPEIETAVRFRDQGTFLIKSGVQNFKENRVVFADSTLFKVFSLKMIQGNPSEALRAPQSVVISQSMAKKYFPNGNPLGKVLTFNNDNRFNVTGVIADMPHNSHFNFDFFCSMSTLEESRDQIWLSFNFHTYYVLRKDANPAAFEAKLFPHLLKKYLDPQLLQMMGKSYAELEKSGTLMKYHIQPLRDIHLKSDLDVELAPNGSIQYVWIFGLAALFVLLIAVVNFMNLSTARSALRAREVGVRKVMGSQRSALIGQFLSESMVLTGFALFLALLFSWVALPYFSQVAGKNLLFPWSSGIFWCSILVGGVLVGLLAGSYPAFFLSGFQPLSVLKGKFFDSIKGRGLRSGLIVFQFLIAIFLISASLVIRGQLNFIQHKKLGFDRGQVLVINDAYGLEQNLGAFKKNLKNLPFVENATISGFLPIASNRSDGSVCSTPSIREESCQIIQQWNVDEDYVPTLGMEITAGRNFSKDMPGDSSNVVLNEKAAKGFFGQEDPLGKSIYVQTDMNAEGKLNQKRLTVIGVIKDFHFESLRQNIAGLCLILKSNPGNLSVKLSSTDLPAALQRIEQEWKKMAPATPFSWKFMDDGFDEMYRAEIRIGSIFSIFTILSLMVACLGLLGLAAFTAERRTKEIGIRKIMGATTQSIIAMLSKEILRLVIVAFAIATPLAWWGANQWLHNFAYRIPVPWWGFLSAGLLAVLVALLTVVFQSIKSARMEPVESLKSE
jgi:putative ABC transport system permease protein